MLYISLIYDVQLLNFSSVLNVISFNSWWSHSHLAICISYNDHNLASLYFSSLWLLLSTSLIDSVMHKTSLIWSLHNQSFEITSFSALAQLIQDSRSWQEDLWWSVSFDDISSAMMTCRSSTWMNVNCWNVKTFQRYKL